MTKFDVDYGPLTHMIGTWYGDKGVDVAPEPDGQETNPYHETITVSEAGGVSNAEEQDLAVLHYHLIVTRKTDEKPIHNETGYWIWDAEGQTVMHSLTIPRGVCVLAGGSYAGETDDNGHVILNVAASLDDDRWGIVQSPFMLEKARTTSFSQKVILGENSLVYKETTMVDIFGKVFEHTDENELKRK